VPIVLEPPFLPRVKGFGIPVTQGRLLVLEPPFLPRVQGLGFGGFNSRMTASLGATIPSKGAAAHSTRISASTDSPSTRRGGHIPSCERFRV
jgi:hypothetical protein